MLFQNMRPLQCENLLRINTESVTRDFVTLSTSHKLSTKSASQSLVFPLISVDSFSPENLEISRKLLIFAVETMNEYGQTGI